MAVMLDGSIVELEVHHTFHQQEGGRTGTLERLPPFLVLPSRFR